jgi:hypothetical protein
MRRDRVTRQRVFEHGVEAAKQRAVEKRHVVRRAQYQAIRIVLLQELQE